MLTEKQIINIIINSQDHVDDISKTPGVKYIDEYVWGNEVIIPYHILDEYLEKRYKLKSYKVKGVFSEEDFENDAESYFKKMSHLIKNQCCEMCCGVVDKLYCHQLAGWRCLKDCIKHTEQGYEVIFVKYAIITDKYGELVNKEN